MAATVGVLREDLPDERRVALVPSAVKSLFATGITVVVERGAGADAGYADEAYVSHGATMGSRRQALDCDVLVQVNVAGTGPRPNPETMSALHPGQILVGLAGALDEAPAVRDLAERGVTLFALELMPRITRAQAMDVLSSQATVSGYKAVIVAAEALPKMFPLLTTAAGTVTPARVLVIGAGVAGLQAIATAKRLGAVVDAYDVRPAAREQVQSLGARFVDLALEAEGAEASGGYARAMDEPFYERQRAMLADVIERSDVVITTAMVPGQRAPLLVSKEAVARMGPGSVIVDLAAPQGGNCELTQPGSTIVEHGVTIGGPTNLPATVPFHASQMYAKNAANFLLHLFDAGRPRIDLDDEITSATLVVKEGEVLQPAVMERLPEAKVHREEPVP